MDKRLEVDISIKKKETTLTPQQNPNVLRTGQAFCALSSPHAAQLCFSSFPVGGLFPWLPVLASNSWHLGTGWKHCSVFLSLLQEQWEHDRFLVGNSSRWYHWSKLGDFALLHPCLPGIAPADLCIPAGHCLVTEVLTWALELVSLPSCTGDSTGHLQLLQPQVFPFSHTQQQGLMRHKVHSQPHVNRRAGHCRHS